MSGSWTKPTAPKRSSDASSGSSSSATASTELVETGPPTNTGSSSPAIGDSSGTASPTEVSVGRFSTRPIAPSSPCSAIRTTVRWKFGSLRTGAATSSCPRSVSLIVER